jgi:hypothetical protein
MALCRAGALQYSAVRFCVSCAAFATTFARKYGDGSISGSFAYLPLTIAVNVSQTVALAASDETKEAQRAFGEKRKPVFKGR